MGGPQKGFSLLELAVVVMVLSIVFAVLLNRLWFYQEVVERARFEATLSLYKTALQIRLAELIVEGREGAVAELEGENPTRWLSEKPTNYDGPSSQLEMGAWHFDEKSRELVYKASTGQRLVIGQDNSMKELRFRAKILYQPIVISGASVMGIGGIALVPSQRYQWF